MEDLFALFNNNSIAGEIVLLKNVGNLRLFLAHSDAALLHQTPCLAVRSAEAASRQQIQNADFSVLELRIRQNGGGHVLRVAAAAEKPLGSLLRLLRLGLAVNQLRQLIGQNLSLIHI